MTGLVADTPQKRATYIPGLDAVTEGGLAPGRITLLVGAPGTAKTVLSTQLLVAGIEHGEPGVLVSFEERPEDIAGNVKSFGWDLADMVAENTLRVIDVSPQVYDGVVSGNFDLEPLISRIVLAAEEIGATRVVIDSADALFSRFPDDDVLRFALRRVAESLRAARFVTVLTLGPEHLDAAQSAGRGVEEYVVDNVILLRNDLDGERRRRTIEVIKMRGGRHREGRFPFTISDHGVQVVPIVDMVAGQGSSEERVSWGIPGLDAMCGGGLFDDSIVLVSGATGTGKTLTTSHYVDEAVRDGQKALLLGYEESHDQLTRNAKGWGLDFPAAEARGDLVVHSIYPEAMSLQMHLARISDMIEEHQPTRLAVDSLTALERAGSETAFREFVIGITSLVKARGITALLTATSPTLTGGTSVTESHISTLTDTIVLLRYVESYGSLRRGLAVIKMRGSSHVKDIREFTIDSDGMKIGRALTEVNGILSGVPTTVDRVEMERIAGMFEDGS